MVVSRTSRTDWLYGKEAPLHSGGSWTLRRRGICYCRDPGKATAIQRIVAEYANHLRDDQGLTTGTLTNYCSFAKSFLSEQFGAGPVALDILRGLDVIEFVRRKAAFFGPARAKTATTALRSFLRYIRYCGGTQYDLAGAVPSVPNWSMTAIPRAIADHLRAVLGGCRRDTAIGRRDYAILMLLARLGLRAAEIVALTLDDIDWDAGSIAVVGKGESACCPSPSVRCRRGARPIPAMGTPRLRKSMVSARKCADTCAWTPDDDRQDRRCGDPSRGSKNTARRLASVSPRLGGGHATAWSNTRRDRQPSSPSTS